MRGEHDIPECLNRRYEAMDELINELDSTRTRTADDSDEEHPEEEKSTTDHGVNLMCDFWNILKENSNCDLPNMVQQKMDEGPSSQSRYSRPRSTPCYTAKDDIKIRCCADKNTSQSPRTQSTNSLPLTKVLCNLKEAASYDNKCTKRLNELLKSENQLKNQIEVLENREKAEEKMLKEADCMWSCMEGSYKQKIAGSLSRQQELSKQLKAVETSLEKWRTNKKELESQVNSIKKCHTEMTGKINQKKNDIKCMEIEIEGTKKRIEDIKKNTETIKKSVTSKIEKSNENMTVLAKNINTTRKLIEEHKKQKKRKEKEGEIYVKEARDDLKQICKVLLRKKLENEDLTAAKDQIVNEIKMLEDCLHGCKDRCSKKQETLFNDIQKVDTELKKLKMTCGRCNQYTDTDDRVKYCTDCPRCLGGRDCLYKEGYCESDNTTDCICQRIKTRFLENVLENMSTVLQRQVQTQSGKTVADHVLNCLKNSRNGKLNSETKDILRYFVLNSLQKYLNLTVVGGAVKTKCELDPESYKQLMLCLTKVPEPKAPPKSDKGIPVKKKSCARWGGVGECFCPKGPKDCVCTTKAPPRAKDRKPCFIDNEYQEEAIEKCPQKDKIQCGMDCDKRSLPPRHVDLEFGQDPCCDQSCSFNKDSKTAQSFNKDSKTAQSFNKDSKTAQSFNKDSKTAQSFNKDSKTAQLFNKDSKTAHSFNKDSKTAQPLNKGSKTAHSFNKDSKTALLFIKESMTAIKDSITALPFNKDSKSAQFMIKPKSVTSINTESFKTAKTGVPIDPSISVLGKQILCKCKNTPEQPCLCSKGTKQMKADNTENSDMETCDESFSDFEIRKDNKYADKLVLQDTDVVDPVLDHISRVPSVQNEIFNTYLIDNPMGPNTKSPKTLIETDREMRHILEKNFFSDDTKVKTSKCSCCPRFYRKNKYDCEKDGCSNPTNNSLIHPRYENMIKSTMSAKDLNTSIAATIDFYKHELLELRQCKGYLRIIVTGENGEFEDIHATVIETESGHVGLYMSKLNSIVHSTSKEKESPVLITRSLSGKYTVFIGHCGKAPNAELRRTSSGGVLAVIAEPAIESTENRVFKVKIKGTSSNIVTPPGILKLTTSGNYVLVLDKEFEKQHKHTINNSLLNNTECLVEIEKVSSNTLLINFDIDINKLQVKNHALLVKSPENIKILVSGPIFKCLGLKMTKSDSKKAFVDLLSKISSYEILKDNRLISEDTSSVKLKKKPVEMKSSSESQLYEKVRLKLNQRGGILSTTSAILRKTSSGQLAVVLDKDTKKTLIDDVKILLENNSQITIPVKRTVSGEITINLTGKNKGHGPFERLKITPSGNIFIVVDEKTFKTMGSRISVGYV